MNNVLLKVIKMILHFYILWKNNFALLFHIIGHLSTIFVTI